MIRLPSGELTYENVLYVRNVTGVSLQIGYRLYWGVPGRTELTPAQAPIFTSAKKAAEYADKYGLGKPTRMGMTHQVNPRMVKQKAELSYNGQ